MIQEKINHVTNAMTQVGAWGAVIGSILTDHWFTIISALVAVIGLGVNWYYKHKNYKLAEKKFLQSNK